MPLSTLRSFNQVLTACPLALFRPPRSFLTVPVHTACATPRLSRVIRQPPDSSAEPLPQTQGCDRQNPEHQVAHYFGRPAHSHRAPAKEIFEPAIDPFAGTALAKTLPFRRVQRDPVAPLHGLNNRHMAQGATKRMNGLRIVSR